MKDMADSAGVQCHVCHETVAQQPVRALCNNWHPECFKCSVCERNLKMCYYARQEVLFCKKDYLTRFRNICHRCGNAITGPIIIIGDITFHTECLVCSACDRFLSEEDDYALLERHKLLCDGCCVNALQSPWNESSHVIQHLVLSELQADQQTFEVEIAESPVKNKLSLDGIRRESATLVVTGYQSGDPGGQKLAIKPGDKVLEVNRQAIDDHLLENMCAVLMSRPTTVSQITVERDPSSMSEMTQLSRQRSVEACDDKKSNFRKRSISLFTQRVFKRSPHATDQRATTSSKQISDCNQNTVANGEEPPKNRNKANRSSSLPRSYSLSDVPKVRSPIHRAQSFKNNPAHNRVFRPTDLLIGEVIGKGFFGQVVKVTHKQTGEVMVAKELLRYDEAAKTNFLQEVALLKSLDHPNVLRFIGVVFKGRTLNLITEYVAGGTVRSLLKDQDKPLSWSLRVKLAKDIAAGMAYLHSMNVIHRDLNSKNCLVQHEASDNDEDMTAVVADVGLAKIVHQRSPSPQVSRKTPPASPGGKPPVSPGVRPPAPKRRYTVVGSPYWMAPEMLEGLAYNHTVDVFSFGIVLCEIIGRVKADPEYLPRLSNFALDEESFRLQFCSRCPETFYLLAFRCCCMDPDGRPAFSQLESWLEAILVHLELGIPLPTELEFSLMPKNLKQSTSESGDG